MYYYGYPKCFFLSLAVAMHLRSADRAKVLVLKHKQALPVLPTPINQVRYLSKYYK